MNNFDLVGCKILLIDDDVNSLDVLSSLLEDEGFKTDVANSGKLGLELFQKKEYDLILLDILMKEMDGFEVCRLIHEFGDNPNLPIIFITGTTDYSSLIKGFKLGAVDYIVKPFFEAELLARIRTHLRLKRFQDNLEKIVEKRTAELKNEITQRKKIEIELETSNVKLHNLMHDSLELLASIVEMKDPLTSGHQKNVTYLSVAIGEKLGLDSHKLEGLKVAAMVHDIGKIKIPLEILSKAGKLNEAEIEIIRSHAEIGYELLKDIDFPWPIAEIVYQHHERFNGSGYPRGLKNDEILFESQILSLSEVVEAISYHRPYREGLGLNTAIDEIVKGKGILFNPQIVDVCVSLIKNDKFKFGK